MTDDALERLKQRQRPIVPSRDVVLSSGSVDVVTSGTSEVNYAVVETKTRQTTIRLEASVSKRLSDICRSYCISREVFIEALFENYESSPETWSLVISVAKTKNEQRMRNANFKRAKSMIQKFS
jgi:hypothetical protein